MSVTRFTEGLHAGEFCVGIESDRQYSNDTGTLAAGNNLPVAAVLGKIVTAGSEHTAPAASNTGNGVLSAVSIGPGAKLGAYGLRITRAAAGAGDFELIDPDGDIVGLGSVGAAFSDGGLSFTLAAGTTDFSKGDLISIGVSALVEKWTQYDSAATNGAQIAAGILFDAVDATAADTTAVIVARNQIVNGALLAWPAGISAPDIENGVQQLVAHGIVVR